MSTVLDKKDQLRAAEGRARKAAAEYKTLRDDVREASTALREHDAFRDELERTRSDKHAAAGQAADDARAALAAYLAATTRHSVARREAEEAELAAAAHAPRRLALQATLAEKEAKMDAAWAAKADADGVEKKAKMVYEGALDGKGFPPDSPPPLLPCARLLESWTIGSIERAGRFVSGYPHADDQKRTQRFVFHLDSGNSKCTIMNKITFDYLGLGCAPPKGYTQVQGVVPGIARRCPYYDINFSLDSVNQLKPGTIFRKTCTAIVMDQGTRVGVKGHWDLLLSAEDSQKMWDVDKKVQGAKLRFTMLSHAPEHLYDGRPVATYLYPSHQYPSIFLTAGGGAAAPCGVRFDPCSQQQYMESASISNLSNCANLDMKSPDDGIASKLPRG